MSEPICVDKNQVLKMIMTVAEANRRLKEMNKENKDLIEVVRCKDCKYRKPNGYCAKELTPYSGFATEEESDNWFCAGGKRRTE